MDDENKKVDVPASSMSPEEAAASAPGEVTAPAAETPAPAPEAEKAE